ncbi:hypothetical protein Kpol_1002p13 [Vanderwaltozyma polyspora DSM 70294]|uniref:Glycine cleavage system P protein n=1 Tax=Vanderwaltozyma polyspora (strain ATCC 22028 / DSM 70294 / BCRC 21397 / CBS 2163 / NBRC 10782 / NRRL Y-8283 / UCD 57-17) TaxID=436907 RepID=A7TE46_VANPO|nr:uncharacterized protein Kpol_1002p13 [Vanderwaltozyma polyspora DSM 70294]EDO19368.1 hypothetical protein Kpol_1002p13 [Vanderwaltozyma polyspora DSM 70294]
MFRLNTTGLVTLRRSALRCAQYNANSAKLRSNRGFSTSLSHLQARIADVSSAEYSRIYNPDVSNLNRPLDTFERRHLGPTPTNVQRMLAEMGYADLDTFVKSVVPPSVLQKRELLIDAPSKGYGEQEVLNKLETIANKNNYKVKNYIGKGYYGTILPPVIQRNVLESPEWYTSYTPYQPEISQGRLESLLNFQTVVSELTGLPVANASLLDEGTAAGEAMLLSFNNSKKKKTKYVIDKGLHPQTKSVIYSRANPFNIEVIEIDCFDVENSIKILSDPKVSGCLVQYPSTDGTILPGSILEKISQTVHANKGLCSVASDLMALTLLKPPAEFGADIVLGSTQRFGVPLGYGGPHAAFFSVIDKLNRKIPGRIVGVSVDRLGSPALRLALQTREQHIKREKATSNICTAQALLANIAANYCVYHGPEGLKNIAKRIYGLTTILANEIKSDKSRGQLINTTWFDTLSVKLNNNLTSKDFLKEALEKYNINLFAVDEKTVSLSIDETTTVKDVEALTKLFTSESNTSVADFVSSKAELETLPNGFARNDKFLQQDVFNLHHSETAMLRYLHRLQSRDLSLANSMIPLGSCTMKLNATAEMIPITWPQFANIHPFQPVDQVEGYKELMEDFEKDLCTITGFDGVSLQPNSGAQGEYTGLRVIKAYLEDIGEGHRDICLIPVSAHGTNPASSAMAGLNVVPVNCLENGSLDLKDLKEKSAKYKDRLAAAMITYPSTYGLFEEGIKEAIDIVHQNGAQVYLDGANMNAQVGLTSPGDLGADVCHLNCHKTFAIPHGGGGPAGAPICVKKHLMPFLPSHDVTKMITNVGSEKSIKAVSSGPYGNALVTPISYAYIKMMGSEGLPFSSVIAMLNANYMMTRFKSHYDILFINDGEGFKHCAHEFIVDLRKYKTDGIEAIDIAKRLQDYGFHAPTLAFPVPGTLMIEPTESENLEELDRFVDAMISIKSEIDAFIAGKPEGMVLKNAPHSLEDLISGEDWETRGYTREQAAYPLPYLKYNKFWPPVARLDDTYGDMNLMCTCPSVEEVSKSQAKE